jgi:hypothetical protein
LHTTGVIDGALTFNGTSDYVNVGNVIGTGAYTKFAWVKRDGNDADTTYNNIISSGVPVSHALYAPKAYSFKLSAGHTGNYNQVQDPNSLQVGVWYQVAVTFEPNGSTGRMVLYKNGVKVAENNSVTTQVASPNTYIGRFSSGLYFKGSIDNAIVFDRALTAEEIAALYNEGNGTENLSEGSRQASYTAKGWSLDTAGDLAVKVDFHCSDVSMAKGWAGISIGDDTNYVAVSAGSQNNASYFYYEAVVDGNVVFEQEPRTSDDGTLYISYDAALKEFYVSHTGFGSGNAYVWSAPNPTQGQWGLPVKVSVGGGSSGAALDTGEAYLDNFEMAKATLLGWPPVVIVPEDNFDDNRRSSMWRLVAQGDFTKLWLAEDATVLNVGALEWMDLTPFCVGHWKMNDNEDNKTVVDSSGNGRDGTAQRDTNELHTTGVIDGALTFNGTSDYVNVGNVIGTGAYTKFAWVKRDGNDADTTYNNIISSGVPVSHALYAPKAYSFKLSAGHTGNYNQVQDPNSLQVGVWYQVAVTFEPNGSTGRMVLYKNGVKVAENNTVPTQVSSPTTYIGRFSSGLYFKGSIDNAMVFNRALTAEEIAALYNGGSGTEIIPGGGGEQQASYAANGWSFDTAEDLAVKVDFHYGDISAAEGWIGMSVGDDVNYVSISTGSDSNASYFYYEAVVDGNMVFEQEPRASDDGTLYISYDAALKEFYVSRTGFGSDNAYAWSEPNLTQGQWGSPVKVSVGGGSSGTVLEAGEAYLDNFKVVTTEAILGWPPATDIDENGFIELNDLKMICENWLGAGEGDIVGEDGIVNFLDFAEFGLAW